MCATNIMHVFEKDFKPLGLYLFKIISVVCRISHSLYVKENYSGNENLFYITSLPTRFNVSK